MDINLLPQKESTNSQFNSHLYATSNFIHTLGKTSYAIAAAALEKIKRERVPLGAYYLQACEFNGIRFWLIDDGDHITALLPENY